MLGILPSRNSRLADLGVNGDGTDLIVTLRRWGSSLNVFKDGGSATEPLWQLQVRHAGQNSFGFQILRVAQEAMLRYPDENIRDLDRMEEVHKVRLLHGAPALSGETDPDKVGIEPWQVVLYAAGSTPNAALDFIKFILMHKVAKGHVQQLPKLAVASREAGVKDLPAPWQLDTESVWCQKPFGALPPRGRRHVLCQLELKAAAPADVSADAPVEEGTGGGESDVELQASYCFSVFGNIYNYRDLFDAAGIPGGYVVSPDEENREYVRSVEVSEDAKGKRVLQSILEEVLLKIPVYFINATGDKSNALASWLSQQPSVIVGEHTS
jgi:hypothetical protein